jgi:hypothetical protein
MQSISELATSEHDADDMAEQENEGFIKGKPPNQLYTCFAKFVKNSREPQKESPNPLFGVPSLSSNESQRIRMEALSIVERMDPRVCRPSI